MGSNPVGILQDTATQHHQDNVSLMGIAYLGNVGKKGHNYAYTNPKPKKRMKMLSQIQPDMTLEQIQELIGNNLEITTEKLDQEARKQSALFNALQRLLMLNTRKLEKEITHMEKIKLNRYRHYTGKMTSEHYKKEPQRETILKADVDTYIKNDQLYIEQSERLRESERIVKYLEDCKKQLTERGYLIKTMLDFAKMNLGS